VELVAILTVLAADRYTPFVGTVEPEGINEVAVELPVSVRLVPSNGGVIFTKSVPLKARTALSLTASDTPDWPDALNVTVYVADVLITIYVLLAAGAVMVIAADAGEAIMIAY